MRCKVVSLEVSQKESSKKLLLREKEFQQKATHIKGAQNN